ncbi:universal stress protein [Helicobacter sp.]|uniref:universal stress protein n=1 Tax=Helicobacter sp. TaxID=218 RepID=UPI0025C63413|nr:universal stress protein [Helicobacter sp.]MCI5633617.1 universal stress protein [Helicobacter sp.]MDY5557138.1 universal stress protein [Helicobacter sp.]
MKDRIVVATDFSQSSLASLVKAMYLAKRDKCTLDIVHVVEYSVFHDPKKDKKAGKEALAKFISDHFPKPEVEISQFCYVGTIHKEIHKHIKDRECCLLVIGATGETQHITDVLLGSVAKRIVRKAEIPVLVAKNESLSDYVNIFSPTDFSDDSLKTAKAAQKFFPTTSLVFYHMIARPFELRLGHYGANDDQISSFNKEAENKAKEVSKEFLRNFTGKVEVVLDSGILSYTRLLSVAESKHASLIALPTSGKISFFALDVLQYSNVDVFICKF